MATAPSSAGWPLGRGITPLRGFAPLDLDSSFSSPSGLGATNEPPPLGAGIAFFPSASTL